MLPKLKAPNYTQVPNLILDLWMPHLDPSLFKIVMYIARKTFGWRIDKEKMSFSQIAEGTNLARRTVIYHIQEGLKIGALERELIPGTNEHFYFLPIENTLNTTPSDEECKIYTPPYADFAQTEDPSANSASPLSANSASPPSDPYTYKETPIKETLSLPSHNPSAETPAGAVGWDGSMTEEEEKAWKAHVADMNKRGQPVKSESGLKKWFLGNLRERVGGQKKTAQSQEERIDKHRREADILVSRNGDNDAIRLTIRDTSLEVYLPERRTCFHIGYALSDEEWGKEVKCLEAVIPKHLKSASGLH
jgi:hypothetical protein